MKPLLYALLCSLAGAAGTADAEPLTALDRANVAVGVFDNSLNLEARVDGEVEFDGSDRDFGDELDINHSRQIDLAELSFRPWEHHQFDLRVYRDARERTVEIDDEISFDGDVFPVQANLTGRAAFRATELHYTWWMRAEERNAWGLQLGVVRLDAELGLRGVIRSPDAGEISGAASVERRVYAPLVGISGRQVVGDHVRLFGEARAIKLSYDGIDGNAFQATAGVEYYPWEHAGIALQYAHTELEARDGHGDFDGRLELGFSGPQALVKLRF